MRILYAAFGRPDRYLIKALKELAHQVEIAAHIGDAASMAAPEPHGAILLDSPAPPIDRVVEIARAAPHAFLILIVSGGDSDQRAAALRAGADACFLRPVHVGEIGGKLDALARRFGANAGAEAQSSVVLHPGQQAAMVAGERVALSQGEFRLLEILARRPGEIVDSDVIGAAVWGDCGDREPASVRNAVARLRRKIEPKLGRRVIQAARGHGYVLTR